MARAPRVTFETVVVRDGSTCFVPVPLDPRPVFGKVRAPVKVTLNGYTYRSTIASMGEGPCLPLRRSHREAAGLEGGETLQVTLELDTDAREVTPPADLVKVGENLFRPLDAVRPVPPAERRIRQNMLERSTVRPVIEMVQLIETSRAYETNIRMIQHQDEMSGQLLGRVLRS